MAESPSTSDSWRESEEFEGRYGERVWDYVEINNPAELMERLHREHWGWKQLWHEELAREAVGCVEGGLHGQWLEYLETQVRSLEEELTMVEGFDQKIVDSRLASMMASDDGLSLIHI